jgi:N-hydroxyarylamine O-acetyltransferase
MNVNNYLNRISLERTDFAADPETLKLLQKTHLLKVPFENLDIHWHRSITLDTENFYRKIVAEGRGGFCYELNGLFNELLKDMGFQTRIISARVSRSDGSFGAEYDHLALLAKIESQEFLVDVGFGDFTAEPLEFVLERQQTDPNGTFLIRKLDDEYFEVVKKVDENWKSEYIFRPAARELSEFAGMCAFHQTSPESHFTRGKVCSLMLENGRKTLTDNKFIVTVDGRKTETDIDSTEEFNQILRREFALSPTR